MRNLRRATVVAAWSLAALWGWCVGGRVPAARADMGSMSFKENVAVYEPAQRALIAWNGKEEILILSTNLHAAQATKVLEVLPLPAEPTVKKADVAVFDKVVKIIQRKLGLDRPAGDQEGGQGAGGFGGAGGGDPPAGAVTTPQVVGGDVVAVAPGLNAGGFVAWVEEHLRKAGVDNPKVPDGLKAVVGEYLDEGYKWFVFDVVSLGTEPSTHAALQYRFASDCVYYPLKISRNDEGDTRVDLLVVTPTLLTRRYGVFIKQFEVPYKPVQLTASELYLFSPEMDELLGGRDGVWLRSWRISARLSSFKYDLKAK